MRLVAHRDTNTDAGLGAVHLNLKQVTGAKGKSCVASMR